MYPKLRQIHLLEEMNSYLKKSAPPLHSHYLDLANIHTLRTSQQH